MRVGRVRWGICALLFFATTINYVDRSVLGVLAPLLRDEIGWSDSEYGQISAAFTLAYAIGFLFAGWFIDRFGTRIGYAVYLIVWSLAAVRLVLLPLAASVAPGWHVSWPAVEPSFRGGMLSTGNMKPESRIAGTSTR